MAFRPEVVDVVVSLGTSQIEQVGFEVPLFATPTNLFTERVRSYSTLDSIVSDGFAVGSPVHRWAENVFAGKFAPSSVKIGRMAYTNTKVTFNQTNYSGVLTLNITVKTSSSVFTKSISTTSLSAATSATDAATAMMTAIEADNDIKDLVTSTVSAEVLTIAPTANDLVSVGYAMENQYLISNTGTETVAVALPLIAAEDNNWYFLSTESHTDTDIKAAAAYAAAATPKRMHVYSSANADIMNASLTTDIASELKAQAYDTSCGFYSETADSDWSEGGVVGAIAAIDPSFGETLHLKTMPSIPVSKLSLTQQEAIWNKNCNFYKQVKGVNVVWEGKCASGEYFDTIRFSHWLAAKIDESLFGYLYRQSNLGQSIKMSDDDLPVLKQVLQNDPLNVAIRNGGILNGFSPDGKVDYSPIVTVPQRKDIPVNDLAARFLDGVTVDVVYANSLHFIKVRAYVTLDRQA